MTIRNAMIAAAILSATAATAQTTNNANTGNTTNNNAAMTGTMSAADCERSWSAADTNRDGVLSMTEGGRYFAAHRTASKPVDGDRLSRENFMTNCQAGMYMTKSAEAGAPFAGANSFTENQAIDRAMSYGFTDISSMQKDNDGIWRGTAKNGAQTGKIAIDYKGNVVFN